ncbi:MAG: glycosyltransferase family 87 protein, partial [Chloroflexota bacterium]
RALLNAVAGLTIVLGVGIGLAIAPTAWAVDIRRNIDASAALLAGQFGIDRGYLYSPLAALLTAPLTVLPLGVAAVAWLVAKGGVLAWGIRHETRGLPTIEAGLVGLAVVAFVPTLHDLLLGNVTVFVVAAVALVAWRRDGLLMGIALGLVLATVPKPQLIPVLAWMLLYRRRALAAAVLTASVATLVGILLTGGDAYRAWIDILRAPEYLGSPMYGNLTPDALIPGLALPIKVAAIVGFLVALRRGEVAGFIAALAVGLLVAPYTMAYAGMALLLAVRPLAIAAPRVTAALAASGSLAVVLLLPAYALAWLAAALRVRFAAGPAE